MMAQNVFARLEFKDGSTGFVRCNGAITGWVNGARFQFTGNHTFGGWLIYREV